MGYVRLAPLKMLLIAVIFALPLNAHAEYYLVYPPTGVVCDTCVPIKHYKKKTYVKHKKHHVKKYVQKRIKKYGVTIRTRYVCPAVINCGVIPAVSCRDRYYKKCQYIKVKKVIHKKYYKKRYAYKRVYCESCSQHPIVTFSGMPTSYEGAYIVNDCNISYDLRTADDDVYCNPNMNYGY